VSDRSATRGATVFYGALWNVASRTIPQFYLALLSIAAARFLGASSFGRQTFIAFTELSLVMVASAGIPTAVTRFVADAVGRRDPAGVHGVVRWGWRVESAAAAVGVAILAAVAASGAEPRAAWALAAIAAGAGILSRVPIALLNGLQRWREAAIVGLVAGGVATGVSIAVLSLGGGITGMFAVEAATAVASLVALAAIGSSAAARIKATRERLSRALRRDATRYALASSVLVLLTFVIWRRSELFVMQRYSTDAEIAFYSVAFMVAGAPTAMLQGFAGAMLPAVATLAGAGELARVQSGYGRSVRLLLVAAVPLTAGLMALAPELVGLVYGSDFTGTSAPLRVLVAFLPLVVVVNVSASVLGGFGRLRPMVYWGLVAVVVDIGLAFLLVPPYAALGAAIANCAAQVTVGVPVIVYACRFVGNIRWEPATLARLLCVSAAGGLSAWICVYLIGGIEGFALGAVAGLVVFAVLARLVGVLVDDDARWLQDVAGRRFGGLVGKAVRLLSGPVPQVRTQ
jgi:O-antigen/teichoic acid export membrane protein